MKIIKSLTIFFSAIALIMPISVFAITEGSVSNTPTIPIRVSGKVSIAENPAADGMMVGVYRENGNIQAKTVTKNGSYLIYIPSDNIGQTLIFKISPAGIQANEKLDLSGVSSGFPLKHNLSVTLPTPPINPDNGDSGGGGYSGGGGSSIFYKVGDINIDGNVNLFDFNLLMMNWGLKITDGLSQEQTRSDISGNKIVDLADFNLLMVNWGK